jgi:pyrroline-5-carboxylate reductase
MRQQSVGIIGGGRIARIVLAGWHRAGRSLSGLVVTDVEAATLERLKADFPSIAVSPDNRHAAAQELVFLAVHPPAFPGVLGEIRESLRPTAALISLAPRWTMSRMCQALGGFNRLARVIPNAPSIVNHGYNPLAFGPALTAEDRQSVRALFDPLGACPEVPEESLEAFAIVAAMGPTYLWYQMYHLIDLGCGFGLTRETAMEAVTAMADGATATMLQAGLPAEGVMDLIPVKPLVGLEPTVKQAYSDSLGGLYRKLKD